MAICSTMDGARHFSMANTCNPREKNVSRIPIACHYVYGDIWGSRCKVSSASLLAWQFKFSLLSLELEKIMQRGKMTWLKFKFSTFYNGNGKRKTENGKTCPGRISILWHTVWKQRRNPPLHLKSLLFHQICFYLWFTSIVSLGIRIVSLGSLVWLGSGVWTSGSARPSEYLKIIQRTKYSSIPSSRYVRTCYDVLLLSSHDQIFHA